MFGFFDPPDVVIASKLPPYVKIEYLAVLSYVDLVCNTECKTKKKAGCMRSIVGSAWACNSVRAGKFQLADHDMQYIQNLGLDCTKPLNEFELSQCEYAIGQLKPKGLIA